MQSLLTAFRKTASITITIQSDANDGKIYFEMNNVPGLRIEPYMDAPRDYIQKVMFQFSGYFIFRHQAKCKYYLEITCA